MKSKDMAHKKGWVYILTNKMKSVLYIGVTADLERRLEEHRNHLVPGFTSKYNCHYVLYLEEFEYFSSAIDREKELKGWRREKKEQLINSFNPHWDDLYNTIILDA